MRQCSLSLSLWRIHSMSVVPFETLTGLFHAVCVVLVIPHAVVHHELLLWCHWQHYHTVLEDSLSAGYQYYHSTHSICVNLSGDFCIRCARAV